MTVPAYFPAGKWYDLYNHSSIDTSDAAQHLPVVVGIPYHAAVYLPKMPSTYFQA